MRHRFPFAVALVASLAAPAVPVRAAGPATTPLDYRAYDGWNAIATPKLSDDGRWLLYTIVPQDGDSTLVARDLTSGKEWREARGAAGAFVGATHVVFAIVPSKKDRDAARKAGKTGDDLPKGDGGILDLATGTVTTIARVDRVIAPLHGERWVAFRHAASPAPSASPAARRTAAAATSLPSAVPTGEETPPPSPGASLPAVPSAAASPSPSPSASPRALDKKKAPAGVLDLRNVETPDAASTIDNVSDVVADASGHTFVYATETANGNGDGVHVRFPETGRILDVMSGSGRYRQLAVTRDGATIAFLTDAASYAGTAPHDVAYVADLHAATIAPKKITDLGDTVLPRGWAPSANGTVAFTRDGRRLRLGTAPFVTPAPSATPSPMKVDLWTYADRVLQSQQRHDADRERVRTYIGMYDVGSGRYVQAGLPAMRDVEVQDGSGVALATDPRPYQRQTSWADEALRDAYVVPLDGAPRRLLVRGGEELALSPQGRYMTGWDRTTRHWYTIATATGKRVVLAPHAGVSFADEEDDHPAAPPAYGLGGWIAGDRGVLVYDRYDVWLADPATGNAKNLTAGAGRRAKLVYSPLQTDPDATAFADGRPLLLSLFDEVHIDQGYARVPFGGGAPRTLLRVPMQVGLAQAQSPYVNHHQRIAAPLVARNADRTVFSMETARSFRDLYTSTTAFASPQRVSDANPQQARYRWGDERQLFYRAADGTPLRATLYTPDGFDPKRDHRPLLITFYERFSDLYHGYVTPAPGTSPNRIRYVSNGYVVMVADVRYKPGHPGASALQCIRAATDAALRVGGIDRTRIGLAGHSWGAYQINYIITKEHRYRAVEAGAAVDDMFSAYSGIRLESGVVREGQYEHGQSRIGATPWDRPDLYMENSGLFGIRSITTPYLTIHNDADGAVPQFQGIEFITAMRRLGKQAYLFSFDGEEHNLVGREQQKYWTVHLDEWFDHWLKNAPRPGWFDGVDFLHRGERNVHALYGEPE